MPGAAPGELAAWPSAWQRQRLERWHRLAARDDVAEQKDVLAALPVQDASAADRRPGRHRPVLRRAPTWWSRSRHRRPGCRAAEVPGTGPRAPSSAPGPGLPEWRAADR